MTQDQKPMAPFDKVDRALEMQVIDWLQWSEFPKDSGMAQLALELIAKRKLHTKDLAARLDEAEKLIQKMMDVIDPYSADMGDEVWDLFDDASDFLKGGEK